MLEPVFLLVLVVPIVLPIVVIATENSGKRANRQAYTLVFLIFVASIA